LSGAQGTYSVNVGPASTSLLVAAYRKPDFVVDVTPITKEVVRGDTLRADSDAKYLFGAPMAGAEASLTSRWTSGSAPTFSDRRELEGFTFDFPCVDNDTLDCGNKLSGEVFQTNEDFLDDVGHQSISKVVPTTSSRSRAYDIEVESNVTDVSRQAFADRALIMVHAGNYYFGVRANGIAEEKKPTTVDVVSVSTSGLPVTGKRRSSLLSGSGVTRIAKTKTVR
jgi:alpha-2-macroglobulin